MSVQTTTVLLGSVSIAAGIYFALSARGSAAEIAKQRREALLPIAVGTCAVAIGFAPYIFDFEHPLEDMILPPGSKALITCDVKVLDKILKGGGEDTLIQKIFKVFNETRGISCETFLPWRAKFHRGDIGYIDDIQFKDLLKPAMWGVDPGGRPFMAFKYTCVNKAGLISDGAMTLFQQYSNLANRVLTGGNFQAKNCSPNLGWELLRHQNHTELAAKLRDFLAGGFIHTKETILSLAK